jgi:nucleoid DNA-binding protein
MSGKYMNKKYTTDKELISDFARRVGVSYEIAEKYIKEFVNSIQHILNINGHLNIRRLGNFALKPRKMGKFRSIYTGEIKTLPLLYMVKFYASQSFKNYVNEKVRKQIEDAREK